MEERESPRRPYDETGTIVLASGDRLSCKIRNVSRRGARLTLASWQSMPRTFDLEDGSGRRRPVRLVWQLYSGLGVRFADADGEQRRSEPGFGRRSGA
jgi:hypothetical protein